MLLKCLEKDSAWIWRMHWILVKEKGTGVFYCVCKVQKITHIYTHIYTIHYCTSSSFTKASFSVINRSFSASLSSSFVSFLSLFASASSNGGPLGWFDDDVLVLQLVVVYCRHRPVNKRDKCTASRQWNRSGCATALRRILTVDRNILIHSEHY